MRARGLGQALEGIKAIASLAGGAVVMFVVYVFADTFLIQAKADAPGGYGGVVANEWLSTGLDTVLPATFLGLVFFGLVASAILSRRVVR